MTIKSIVKEICETKPEKRIEFIISFLRMNNIFFNIHKFHSGINIEVVRKGQDTSHEIIFFSHHDIFYNISEGANDNTSSVAVMLGIIQFLYFFEPKYTIRIVFNDNEEILGGLLFKSVSKNEIESIIENSGSFQYLKNFEKKENILGVFILELSGIGDSIYVATRSGNIKCDEKLNDFLCNIAGCNNYKYLKIPIALTDMISIGTLGIKGTVFGAIPFLDGKNYMDRINNKNINYELYPYVWKKNHTDKDNFYSIQERSLDLIHNFIVQMIKNLDFFEKIKN